MYRINGWCQKCPEGTSYDTTSRSCQPHCSNSNEYYSSGRCICINGFFRINGVCIQCPRGSYYNPLTLQCDR